MLKKFSLTFLSLVMLTSLLACASKQASEEQMINEMTSILQNKMNEDYQAGNTKRDAHPKTLGLLIANFTIDKNLPDELQTEIFQANKTYPAVIRISNASGNINSDKDKDFRGFAIKLIEVQGKRLNEQELHTQDFLFMSNETMPLGTVALFRDAVYYAVESNMILGGLKFTFTGNIGKLVALTKSKHDSSPLDIGYWSTTPYQFAQHKVKYKLVPTSTTHSQLPEPLTDNYLTQNMATHLQKDSASFDFYIQKYIDDQQTPLEDASIAWQSPFIKVASLEIPKQNVNNNARFVLAEQLSFSPANSLEAHQPLGGLNRARMAIYKTLSEYRHQRNQQALKEATANDINMLQETDKNE